MVAFGFSVVEQSGMVPEWVGKAVSSCQTPRPAPSFSVFWLADPHLQRALAMAT